MRSLNGAATFSFGTLTFLALNDTSGGFLQNNNAISKSPDLPTVRII
ncbi:bluetail domain-containing putative surface protein [Nostoc sp. TCL240-02]